MANIYRDYWELHDFSQPAVVKAAISTRSRFRFSGWNAQAHFIPSEASADQQNWGFPRSSETVAKWRELSTAIDGSTPVLRNGEAPADLQPAGLIALFLRRCHIALGV